MNRRNALGLILAGGVALFLLGSKKRRTGRGIDPVKGSVTSGFGNRVHPISHKTEFHNGVDISVKEGTPVHSPWSGTVIKRYFADKGGNQIVIKHDNGYQTGYAHLSTFIAKVGEKVVAGEAIALSGNTGKSTGPHLHFTLRDPDGELMDPQKKFDFA